MFKDKFKELREKEGLSQQELADKLFVSRSAIAKWENGNGIPSDVNLDSICKIFNVEEEWILSRSELRVSIIDFDYKIQDDLISFAVMVDIEGLKEVKKSFPTSDIEEEKEEIITNNLDNINELYFNCSPLLSPFIH